jgi:hypothetical protein
MCVQMRTAILGVRAGTTVEERRFSAAYCSEMNAGFSPGVGKDQTLDLTSMNASSALTSVARRIDQPF